MSTDTNIKTLIFNKLTQEQYNNADKVPTEFYLTPDTSIDSSEKGAANGVASLDTNGKVLTEQIPVATSSDLGGVKPDGNTITVTEDGTISATGGSGSGSGFDFEGTKAEFDAAVAAGTITEDSVSLITDDVSGDNVATKAELQAVDSSKADTSLSNTTPSQSFKEMSVGWGMPDYSAGVSVANSTILSGFTAPSDGVLMFDAGISNATINGIGIVAGYYYTPNSATYGQPVSMLLSKGDILKANNAYGTTNHSIFYPLKGAN